MSGLVLLDKYNKLPTTAWYICWLHTSSGFSHGTSLTSGFTGEPTGAYQTFAGSSQHMMADPSRSFQLVDLG